MQVSEPEEHVEVSTETVVDLIPEIRDNIYVWEWPVRITHWLLVASIVILSVTGIYISGPFIGTTGIATNQYLMGTIRFIHFLTAFVFTICVLVRIYWAFVGNKYANWKQFIPLDPARRRGIRRMVSFYTFIRPRVPAVLGHNPLAGMAYTVVFGLYLLQIITGFALFSLAFHSGAWPFLFGWVVAIFNVQPVRLLHDFIMYLILAFIVHHIYTAVLIDMEEKSGLMSSIFSGYKSLTQTQLEEVVEEETLHPQPARRQRRSAKSKQHGESRVNQEDVGDGKNAHV